MNEQYTECNNCIAQYMLLVSQSVSKLDTCFEFFCYNIGA